MLGDFLAKRMKKTIEKNVKKSVLTKEGIEPVLREIKLTLLDADVNIKVVKKLIESIKEKAINKHVIENLNPSQTLIKIVHTEIKTILGKTTSKLNLSKKPSVILFSGLQGSGKTTSIVKLAYHLQKREQKKVLLVGCDIYRPAAIEQLKVLASKIKCEVFEQGKTEPVTIAKNALLYGNANNFDVILIDTAGRLQIDEKLMLEIQEIRKAVSPLETLIVVDGMIGQEVINIINEFNKKIKLTGAIVTKLDGDTRGGAVLSINDLTSIPIKFVGTGENINNLDLFHPNRMADRILGMGDVETLFEKLKENIDQRTIKTTMRRMMLGQFDLQDYLNNLHQMKNMGKMKAVLRLIPGANKVSDEKIAKIDANLKITEIILNSTTIIERKNSRLLKHITRKQRIIKGSGRSEKEYNELLNQFAKIKKKMDEVKKQINQGKIPQFTPGGNIRF